MNLETIKKDRIDSGGFLGYERELIIRLEAAERLNRVNVIVADRETDRAEKAEAYATEQEDIIKDLQAEVKQLEEKLQVIRDSRANATYKSIMAGKALAEKEKV